MAERRPDWQRSIPRDQFRGGCRACKHLQPGARCAAFRDRIPLAILSGEIDHLVVRPGQMGGTVFEVVEHPSGLALRRIRGAAARGEAWAAEALARAHPAAVGRGDD